MSSIIDFEYGFDYANVINGLDNIEKRLGKHESMLNGLRNNDPYPDMNRNMRVYNTELNNGVKIYQKIEFEAKAYQKELQRLKQIEIELIKAQSQFKDSLEYDEAVRNLEVVRRRMEEVQQGMQAFGFEATKAKKPVDVLLNVAKAAGAFMISMFAIDSLVDVQRDIIEITGEFEKYNAVLTNAFQNEQLASKGLAMVTDIAIKTPYTINELTESYVKYVNRALIPTAEELRKQGDLAATTGKSFEQLTEAILDAVVGENERLKEFGIKAKTVGDNVIISFRGVEKQVKKTDQEAIRQAILSFGDLQGVTGSMNAVMKTLQGTLSNIKDNWDQFLKNLGEKESGPLNGALRLLLKITGALREMTTVDAVTKLQREQAEFNALSGAILLANEKQEVRNALVTELLTKYPSLLNYLDSEKVTNEALARVIAYVNQGYENKIRLAAQDILAKRNAEELANALERQKNGLIAVNVAYQAYLKSQGLKPSDIAQRVSTFNQSSEADRAKIIDQVRKQQQNILNTEKIGPGEIPSKRYEQANEAVFSLDNLTKAQERYQKILKDGVDIQKESAKITKETEELRQKQIDTAKNEIKQLETKKSLNKDEIQRLKELRQFIIGTEKEGQNPEFTKIKPGPDLEKLAKEQAEQRKLLAELEKEYQATQQRLTKIQLDEQNVRLGLLKKNSFEYIEAKKQYDLQLLQQEKETQVKLFAEENARRVKFTDSKGNTTTERQDLITYETNRLAGQGLSRDKARQQALANVTRQFENSKQPNAVAARSLLNAKNDLIEFNTNEDQIALLKNFQGQFNSVLGEGFEKEKAIIIEKYKELFKTYESNTELVNQLRIARDKEVSDKLYASQQKQVDTEKENANTLVELSVKSSGETEIEFQKRKAKSLLEIEVKYYKDSLQKLKDYLVSQAYLNAVSSGQVSEEQKAKYTSMVDVLDAQIKAAEAKLNQFSVSTIVNMKKFDGLFDIGKKVFSDSPIFNGQYADLYKSSLDTLYSSAKDTFNQIFDYELEQTKERIRLYDDQIGALESRLSKEEELRKEGLANNYDSTKKDLEETKKAREEELAHQKQVQKQKALIESAEIASSTAVAAANLIAATAEAIKNWSTIPFVGVFLGLAAAATLVSGFVGVKSRIKSAQQLRKGKRLSGPSHEQGGMDVVNPDTGEVLYNVEGKEWLMGSKPSEEHNELLTHINDDTFRKLPKKQQMRLLGPLGFTESMNSEMLSSLSNFIAVKRSSQSNIDLKELKGVLDEVAKNTGRIPKKQRQPIRDGVIAVYEGDKLSGYEHYNDKS